VAGLEERSRRPLSVVKLTQKNAQFHFILQISTLNITHISTKLRPRDIRYSEENKKSCQTLFPHWIVFWSRYRISVLRILTNILQKLFVFP